MKKLFITLLCVGALSAWIPAGALAATADDLAGAVDSFFAGKMSSEDVLALLAKEAASAENPDSIKALALSNKAVVLRSQKDFAQARAAVSEAVKLNPKTVGGYQILASLDAAAGKFADAVANIDTALANAGGKDDELEQWKKQYQLAATTLDAVAFHKEFQANLFAAEEKYKGKQVSIVGNVDSIERAMNGNPVVVMAAGQFKQINIEMSKDDVAFVAKLAKGNRIIVFATLEKGGDAIVKMKGFPFTPW